MCLNFCCKRDAFWKFCALFHTFETFLRLAFNLVSQNLKVEAWVKPESTIYIHIRMFRSLFLFFLSSLIVFASATSYIFRREWLPKRSSSNTCCQRQTSGQHRKQKRSQSQRKQFFDVLTHPVCHVFGNIGMHGRILQMFIHQGVVSMPELLMCG